MGKLIDKTFIKNDVTKSWLRNNGFHYNRIFSTDEEQIYSYRFPVYQYRSYVTLECEILICINDGRVQADVYDYGTRDKYDPFYYEEQDAYKNIIKIITSRILSQLEDFEITEVV